MLWFKKWDGYTYSEVGLSVIIILEGEGGGGAINSHQKEALVWHKILPVLF